MYCKVLDIFMYVLIIIRTSLCLKFEIFYNFHYSSQEIGIPNEFQKRVINKKYCETNKTLKLAALKQLSEKQM